MSIPRTIHFGCFGGYALSELNRRCMESWQRVLPEYSVMQWGDHNLPPIPWLKRATPINVHNYMLIWAPWYHGGFAMDCDVEMIRPFDLGHGMVVGFQKDDTLTNCINNCIVGTRKGHRIARRILDRMEKRKPDDDPVFLGPGILSDEMVQLGVKTPGLEVKIGDVQIYSKERFSPWFHDEPRNPEKITERTYAVHHYEGSWLKKPIPA